MSGTYTCDSCRKTFESEWTDEEAAAEAEDLFPGMDITNRAEARVVCDDCFQHIMGRVHAEAPHLFGEGWRASVPEVLEDGSLLYETTVPSDSFLAGFGKVREYPLPPQASPDSRCYRISAGMVHIQPGCRCP
jgi:hypothetical protein